MLRLRLAFFTLTLFFGVYFAQAQVDVVVDCFQQAGDYLYNTLFGAPPPLPPTPAPVPPNNPPPMAAAFYRFPIIQPGSQPQTWEELVYYAQSTGVTVDQTVSDDGLAAITRPVNAPLASGMPVIIRAGELGTDVYTAPDGEIQQTLEGNAEIDAQSLETFGDWWHVRFADGTEGWVRLNDVALQPPSPVAVTVNPSTPLYTSPSQNSTPAGTLDGSQPVEAIGKDASGNWFKVRTGSGGTGWIPASAIPQNEQLEQARQLPISDGYSFRYAPQSGEAFCDLPGGMVLQTPEATPAYVYINTMPIEFMGTAVVTTSDMDSDGADETLFITVAEGQVTTLMPDNPFTMTGVGETVGLELNQQGDIVGYTGVVLEAAQQRDILVNAAFTCAIYKGFLYVQPADCNITELPSNLAAFVTTFSAAVAAGEPDVPGLDPTEIAAQPEATALPEGVVAEFNDALTDVFNCQSRSPLALTDSSLRADLGYMAVERETNPLYPYPRTVYVDLHPQLMTDINNSVENFAILIYIRTTNGAERTYIYRSHSGRVALQGQLAAPGQVASNTANLIELVIEEGAVAFNIPDDAVEFRVESYVEEIPGTEANLCDRYPEQGFASLPVADVM